MKPSAKFNLAAVVVFTVAVVLFYLHQTWAALALMAVGAVCAVLAGRAMQHEPRTRSRDEEDE